MSIPKGRQLVANSGTHSELFAYPEEFKKTQDFLHGFLPHKPFISSKLFSEHLSCNNFNYHLHRTTSANLVSLFIFGGGVALGLHDKVYNKSNHH